MKFKLLLSVVAFIPALVMAQGTPKVEAPVAPKVPSAGIPGANGGGVKPAPPVAVNPPAKPTPAPQQQGGGLTTGGLMQLVKPPATPAPAPAMYSGAGPLPANDTTKPPVPPSQVGGANTQLGDGRTLQSINQPQQQVGQTGGLQPPLSPPENTGGSSVNLQFEAGNGN
jgi:hypothetical protein